MAITYFHCVSKQERSIIYAALVNEWGINLYVAYLLFIWRLFSANRLFIISSSTCWLRTSFTLLPSTIDCMLCHLWRAQISFLYTGKVIWSLLSSVYSPFISSYSIVPAITFSMDGSCDPLNHGTPFLLTHTMKSRALSMVAMYRRSSVSELVVWRNNCGKRITNRTKSKRIYLDSLV